MLTRMEIKLKSNEHISQRSSYAFQGILMDMIDDSYAKKLHISGLKPYSQHLSYKDGMLCWQINTLNDEAANFIIRPLIDESVCTFRMKQHDTVVEVIDRQIYTIDEKELFKYNNSPQSSYNVILLKFVTPTAFKQNDRYTFIPDFKCIYNSLINKYNTCCTDNDKEKIEVNAEHLTDITELISYKTESTYFRLKGVNIPGFTGVIKVRLKNKGNMGVIACGLLYLSNYCGIGIKNSIGMGAVEITESY